MKILILVAMYTVTLFSATLHYEQHFGAALQKADREKKELMLMYSATWCPECEYMKDVVFKDRKIAEYIEKHFVVLVLDIDKDTLPKQFHFIGIPTFFFVNGEGKETDKIIGGSKADIFLQKLKAIQ